MPLSDCFVDLIAYVAYGITQPDTLPGSCEDLARNLHTLIEAGEDKRVAGAYSREDYDLARFAVFVWIDETIMKSAYPAKRAWQKRLLQRAYYKTTGGGVEFYKKLEALEADQDPVREVYFLCLALGYSGRYGLKDEDRMAREAIKSRQLKRLTGSTEDLSTYSPKEKMFPGSYGGEFRVSPAGGTTRRGLSLINLCLGLGPLAVFAFLYVLYRFILNNEIAVALVH